MRLNAKLNIVFPVDTDAGTVHVHSTPLDRATWEQYYLVLSKTFSRLFTEGLSVVAGPPIAAMLLRQVAQETAAPGGGNAWDGPDGASRGLMAEIRRRTNVTVSTDRGWETVPYEVAVREKRIDEDDAAEVENVLVFFIVTSAVLRRADKMEPILDGMSRLWDVLPTSLNSTEYAASLPTSTEAASTGETATTWSPPS